MMRECNGCLCHGCVIGLMMQECFAALKSSPVDSLVWRLGTATVYTMKHLNGIEGVAHLWHEIVLELRFRWENGITIPG